MQKINTNDQVIVITGKDKGKVAKVLRVMDDRLVVEGVNVVKKHVRPNPNRNIEGGIVAKEATIHGSNVAIYNAATKKADRVGVRVNKDGKKERFYKSNNELIA